jgi:hypothetical protein
MTPEHRNEELRQTNFQRHPDAAKYIEEEVGYKADVVCLWVYDLMQGFAAYKLKWTPIMCEADLEQPPGLYWTTFVDEDAGHQVGSERIYGVSVYGDSNKFAANTVAYMRIDEPNPWKNE